MCWWSATVALCDLPKLQSTVTPPLSIMLRKGVISGNPITYISRLYVHFLSRTSPRADGLRRWNTNNVPHWKGFFSEVLFIPQPSKVVKLTWSTATPVSLVLFFQTPPTTTRNGRTSNRQRLHRTWIRQCCNGASPRMFLDRGLPRYA